MKYETILGPLEQEIMDCMWEMKTASVRDIHTNVSARKEIAYTTIMTVMGRLTEKGYLKRGLVGNQHIYKPARRRTSFMKNTLSTMAKTMINNFGEDAVLTFIDEVDKQGLSEEKKRELIAKLQNEDNK